MMPSMTPRTRSRGRARDQGRMRETIVRASENPLERFFPPHRQRSGAKDGASGGKESSGGREKDDGAVEARGRANESTGTGGSGGRSAGRTPTLADADPGVRRTRAALDDARPGDLLMVETRFADGSDVLASGRDQMTTRWFVVRRIGTSAGGRKMLEGELEGKLAQIVDQGGTQEARIGIQGALFDERGGLASAKGVRDAKAMKRVAKAHAKRVNDEMDKATLVSQAASALTLEMLESAVRASPDFWTRGNGAHSRRVITDATENATKMAGELLALKHGHRDVVLTQITSDWECGTEDSIRAPFAASVLEDILATQRDVAVEISEARYETENMTDGEPQYESGVTFVVYRTVAEHRAKLLASMGVQATRNVARAFEQALVGVALGYDDANVEYHVRHMNEENEISTEEIRTLIENARQEIDSLLTTKA